MGARRAADRLAAAALCLAPFLAGCVQRTAGEQLYRERCADCHGVDGSGNTVRYMGNQWANLLDDSWQSADGDEYSLGTVVREGVFAKMPGNADLSDEEVREIVGWVLHLRGETP